MKTSNKLIGLGVLVLLVSVIVFVVKAKSALVTIQKEQPNEILAELSKKTESLNNELIEKNLGQLKATTLDLSGHHRILLDPSMEDVLVVGRPKFLNGINEMSDSMLFEVPVFYEHILEKDFKNNSREYNPITDTLYYKIGTKNMKELVLMISDDSEVTTVSSLDIPKLSIVMNDRSSFEGELNVRDLEIHTRSDSNMNLSGLAQSVKITCLDQSRLHGSALLSPSVDIMLSDHSRVSLGGSSVVKGVLRDNSYYKNYGYVSSKDLIVRNSAIFD